MSVCPSGYETVAKLTSFFFHVRRPVKCSNYDFTLTIRLLLVHMKKIRLKIMISDVLSVGYLFSNIEQHAVFRRPRENLMALVFAVWWDSVLYHFYVPVTVITTFHCCFHSKFLASVMIQFYGNLSFFWRPCF